MIRVGVCGACGRMGDTVCDVVSEQRDLQLAAVVEVSGHCRIGSPTHGLTVADDLTKVVGSVDVVVDFTSPKAAANHARISSEHGKAVVIGTTGLGGRELEAVEKAAKKVPVLLSPNMSVGVNLLFKLADMVSRVIPETFDVEVIEAHHRTKKDSPSGTAARIARIIAEARNLSSTIYGREGMVGERPRDELGVHAIRGGDIVGEHTILYAGDGERFEITHRAHSRRTFATGVPAAVRFIVKQKPGLYDMMDVLGLKFEA